MTKVRWLTISENVKMGIGFLGTNLYSSENWNRLEDRNTPKAEILKVGSPDQ